MLAAKSLAMLALGATSSAAGAVLRFNIVAFSALVIVVIDVAISLQFRVKGRNLRHIRLHVVEVKQHNATGTKLERIPESARESIEHRAQRVTYVTRRAKLHHGSKRPQDFHEHRVALVASKHAAGHSGHDY